MSDFKNLIKQKKALLLINNPGTEVLQKIDEINKELSQFTFEQKPRVKDTGRKLKFSEKQISKYEVYLENIKQRVDPDELYSKKRNREKEIARVEKILQKHKSRLDSEVEAF